MNPERESAPGDQAREVAASLFKSRLPSAEKKPLKDQVSTGCPICSIYEALAKRGWMRERTESDYRNHLTARHGLEV